VTPLHVVAAPDKFRGSATAVQVTRVIAAGARAAGWTCRGLPLADGGEGMLDAFGGPNRTTNVTGPLGAPVAAEWRLDGDRAVIETARASCGSPAPPRRAGCARSRLRP
jgi:glycerate kinase